MPATLLHPYRRHLAACPHGSKGQDFSLCECPIWAYGHIHGEPFRRSLQTSDWPRALKRIEILCRGGAVIEDVDTSVKLATSIDLFLANCHGRGLRTSTLSSYRNTLEAVRDFFPGRTLASIDASALDALRAHRKVGARTWRKELETLRAFFAWCVERRSIADNPARRVRMPRVDDLATLPFTAGEIEKLIAACDRIASDDPGVVAYNRQRARALVYTALYSGLRISDITILRRSALDPHTKHLTLRTMKTNVPLKVLLHHDAVTALNALPAGSPEYFFWTGNGDPITCTKNLRRTVQRLGKLSHIHAHPHRFRDTFAVELLTNGADIRTVQMLLGHESVKTTEKHYAHFVAAHQALLDSAAATLDFRPKAARPVLLHPLKRLRRNA